MTPRKPQEPLKAGERCRVYEGPNRYKGTVLPCPVKSFPNAVLVSLDVDSCIAAGQKWLGHRFQVRRLRPKKLEEKQERVERWLAQGTADWDWRVFRTKAEAEKGSTGTGTTFHRLVECSDSERVISRAELAKAWDLAAGGKWVKSNSPFYLAFCTALGFPPEEK